MRAEDALVVTVPADLSAVGGATVDYVRRRGIIGLQRNADPLVIKRRGSAHIRPDAGVRGVPGSTRRGRATRSIGTGVGKCQSAEVLMAEFVIKVRVGGVPR